MSEAMKTAFSTAVDGIKADVLSMFAVALPAGLGIAGIVMAARLGIGFFKAIAS